MSRKIIPLILLAAFSGCTKGADTSTPQGTLKAYVSRAFAVKSHSDVDKLLELSTGSAREELEKLRNDEEAFKKSFVDEKNTSDGSIRIRDERAVGADRFSITYELGYKNTSPGAKVPAAEPVLPKNYGQVPTSQGDERVKEASEAKVTVKKNAILVKDASGWKISEVQNIKTFVEQTTEEKISAGSVSSQ